MCYLWCALYSSLILSHKATLIHNECHICIWHSKIKLSGGLDCCLVCLTTQSLFGQLKTSCKTNFPYVQFYLTLHNAQYQFQCFLNTAMGLVVYVNVGFSGGY